MTVHGYAVRDEGGLRVETVSSTKIGAIVNWLYVVRRIPMLKVHNDDVVMNWFDRFRVPSHAECVMVTISESAT